MKDFDEIIKQKDFLNLWCLLNIRAISTYKTSLVLTDKTPGRVPCAEGSHLIWE